MRIILLLMLGIGIFCSSCKDTIDECADIDCEFGDCGLGVCICDEGFEGNRCDTEIRTKFIGAWNADFNGCLPEDLPNDVKDFAKDGIVLSMIQGDILRLNLTIEDDFIPVNTTADIIGTNDFMITETKIETQLQGFDITVTLTGFGTLIEDDQIDLNLNFDIPFITSEMGCARILDRI